jgi:hypothetical protein
MATTLGAFHTETNRDAEVAVFAALGYRGANASLLFEVHLGRAGLRQVMSPTSAIRPQRDETKLLTVVVIPGPETVVLTRSAVLHSDARCRVIPVLFD